METLESLRRKIEGAEELNSVVRTMKAMAASNIGQYQNSVLALGDYYNTITLGILASILSSNVNRSPVGNVKTRKKESKRNLIITFGSDQGLVGQFNDAMLEFLKDKLNKIEGSKEIWAIGERIQLLCSDAGYRVTNLFQVPNTINAITPLVSQLLIGSEEGIEEGKYDNVFVIHNYPHKDTGYSPSIQRLLPLDEEWRDEFTALKWPDPKIPEIAGSRRDTLKALIREYLFVSLFKACSESLASENSSRLEAMQRAEKNIEDLLNNLSFKFHRLRQSTIDEELFDVVSGFESLRNKKVKN